MAGAAAGGSEGIMAGALGSRRCWYPHTLPRNHSWSTHTSLELADKKKIPRYSKLSYSSLKVEVC